MSRCSGKIHPRASEGRAAQKKPTTASSSLRQGHLTRRSNARDQLTPPSRRNSSVFVRQVECGGSREATKGEGRRYGYRSDVGGIGSRNFPSACLMTISHALTAEK